MSRTYVQFFLLFAAATVLYGQPMARLTVATTSDGKSVLGRVYNDSAVPMTAFFVTTLSPGSPGDSKNPVIASSVSEDAVTDTQFPLYVEIPPGGEKSVGGTVVTGNPDDVHIQLQAALFADGSSFGDPDWVDYLINRRRNALREIDAAIADLKAGKGLSLEELIDALIAAQSREDAPAKAAALANGQESARFSPEGNMDIFREKSPAQKKANSLFVQASDWSNQVVRNYGHLISALKKLTSDASPADVSVRVSTLVQSLDDEREAFVASRPGYKLPHY